ncbi:MAG: hypothetical protein OXC29_22430 [Rhodococcus sp.]|nr:hypothetical protein [Rhodococcus sp. (in: high G+C Gram-positive bacteria)]
MSGHLAITMNDERNLAAWHLDGRLVGTASKMLPGSWWNAQHGLKTTDKPDLETVTRWMHERITETL